MMPVKGGEAPLLAKGIDYICKTFHPDTLIHAVEKALLRINGYREELAQLRQQEQMGITAAGQVLRSFGAGETVDRGNFMSGLIPAYRRPQVV